MLLHFKLFSEEISAILYRSVTLTHPLINKLSIKTLRQWEPVL